MREVNISKFLPKLKTVTLLLLKVTPRIATSYPTSRKPITLPSHNHLWLTCHRRPVRHQRGLWHLHRTPFFKMRTFHRRRQSMGSSQNPLRQTEEAQTSAPTHYTLRIQHRAIHPDSLNILTTVYLTLHYRRKSQLQRMPTMIVELLVVG